MSEPYSEATNEFRQVAIYGNDTRLGGPQNPPTGYRIQRKWLVVIEPIERYFGVKRNPDDIDDSIEKTGYIWVKSKSEWRDLPIEGLIKTPAQAL